MTSAGAGVRPAGADERPLPGARIALVDLGLGNRRSVEKALERVGADVRRVAHPAGLADADGLVLPGVGAFPEAMRRLRAQQLLEPLLGIVRGGTPILGLCLGMQLLFEGSDELGGDEGLGLLEGRVRRLDPGIGKLPHIGWNALSVQQPEHALVDGLPQPLPIYHVHSFVAEPADPSVVIATGLYGEQFPSLVGSGTVLGAQGHPEKSSADGLGLLANFTRIAAERSRA